MIRTVSMDQMTVAGGIANGRTKVTVSGKLIGIRVQQGGAPNATLTFTDDDGQTLLTLAANTQADKWYYPQHLTQDPTGVDLVAIYDQYGIDGYLYVAISAG